MKPLIYLQKNPIFYLESPALESLAALKNFSTSTIPNLERLLQELSKLTENCAASDSDDTLETKKDKPVSASRLGTNERGGTGYSKLNSATCRIRARRVRSL